MISVTYTQFDGCDETGDFAAFTRTEVCETFDDAVTLVSYLRNDGFVEKESISIHVTE